MEKPIYWSTIAFINVKMTLRKCVGRRSKKKPTQDSISYHASRQKNHTAQARKIFLYQGVIGFNSGLLFSGKRFPRALACYFFASKSLRQHFFAILSYQKVPGSTFSRYFQAGQLLPGLFGNLFAPAKASKGFFEILFMER